MPPTATLDSPPTSTHFTDSQRLCAPAVSTSANTPGMNTASSNNLSGTSLPPAQYTPQMPMPYGFPQFPMPYFPPFPYYPFYPQHPQAQETGNPMALMQGHGFGLPQIPPNQASGPGSPALKIPRPVPLDEFCKHYKVDDADKERL